MKEQTASKVPQIRFKGFDGEWEEKTLGDLGSFKNGMNFGKEAMGHGNPFVNLQNVFGQFEVDDKKLELAESSSVQRREYNLLKGDVLFIRSSVKPEGVGETALITKTLMDTTYSGFIIRYRPEVMMSHDFNRIAYRTTVVRKQILANASRSANTNINQNALKKIALRIPNFEEQTQIGEYFRELDSLIGLHQRKHDKLVTLKKAMLQKMFPHPGTTTPEIRFKEFEGDWVEKKLGELMPITSAARVHKHEWTRSGVPFFRTSDVVSLYKGEENAGAFISLDLYEKLSDKIGRIKRGDILITGGGSIGIPYLAKSDDPLYFKDADLLWLKVPESIDSIYLYTFFSSDPFREYLGSISHIGTIGHYTVEQAKKTPLTIPLQAEQQKIGSYFRTLDELITKHAIQLQKLQQIKSACLEKMFV
jgi:type I restriction enzyme, S subunit